MDNTIKTIAFYLPQFHEIEENNRWWGKGFTEWENVKKAKPLYDNHYQPRIPLNRNYYDLSNIDVMKWQVEIAKKYGLYGFCFYHYWFNDGHMLLEKPVENFLKHTELNMPFCLSWANEPWTKAWVSKSDVVLINQDYMGEEVWKKHFDYLLPYFLDSRYIKDNNRPIFIVYRPELIPQFNEMMDYFNALARENGFDDGLCIMSQGHWMDELDVDDSRIDYRIEYEPGRIRKYIQGKGFLLKTKIAKKIDDITFNIFGHKASEYYLKVRKLNYDNVWEGILNSKPVSGKYIAGAFVGWDNTPRRTNKGEVIEGSTPQKFQEYMIRNIERVRKYYSTNYIFIFAWNEWAEGGYLEPDEKYQYGYLKALKNALEVGDSTDE